MWIIHFPQLMEKLHLVHFFNSWAYLCLFVGSDVVPFWLQVYKITPLDPSEVGQDQSRVVGGDNGPSVPHSSHFLDD